MAVIGAHCKGPRCYQAAKATFGSILLIEVEGIGVLHALGPSADVVTSHGVLELPAAQWHAHPLVYIAGIEVGKVLSFFFADAAVASAL